MQDRQLEWAKAMPGRRNNMGNSLPVRKCSTTLPGQARTHQSMSGTCLPSSEECKPHCTHPSPQVSKRAEMSPNLFPELSAAQILVSKHSVGSNFCQERLVSQYCVLLIGLWNESAWTPENCFPGISATVNSYARWQGESNLSLCFFPNRTALRNKFCFSFLTDSLFC